MSFDVLLPNNHYPFAIYKNNFQSAKYFLEQIEKLKTELKPFQFIVSRKRPNGEILFDTNMKVSLEEYTISEDAQEGFDVKVKIKLKQYREHSTKTMKIEVKENKTIAKPISQKRATTTAPKVKIYTVKKGDCLWNIAKKYYRKWKSVYENI